MSGCVQGTAEWLAARRDGIGSSDAPVVLGESPYRSALELWAIKTGMVPEPDPDADTARLFRIGHLMEPVLRQLYADATGRRVTRVNRMLRHPSLPWMLASLDGRSGRRLVECKWTNSRRWSATTDPVPGDVMAQVQHALAVSGLDVADVAVLRGSDFRVVEIPRDDEVIAAIIDEERRFWECVERRERPPVDGSEGARLALTRMHPVESSRDLLPASDDFDAIAAELREVEAQIRAAEDRKATLENAVRALLGDAAGVEGPGYRFTWTKNADSQVTDWQALAEALAAVVGEDVATPMRERHTRVKPGPRVLRKKWTEAA